MPKGLGIVNGWTTTGNAQFGTNWTGGVAAMVGYGARLDRS